MSEQPTDPLAALDLAVSSIVLDVTIDEFVAEPLVIPLAMVVLRVLLHRVS